MPSIARRRRGRPHRGRRPVERPPQPERFSGVEGKTPCTVRTRCAGGCRARAVLAFGGGDVAAHCSASKVLRRCRRMHAEHADGPEAGVDVHGAHCPAARNEPWRSGGPCPIRVLRVHRPASALNLACLAACRTPAQGRLDRDARPGPHAPVPTVRRDRATTPHVQRCHLAAAVAGRQPTHDRRPEPHAPIPAARAQACGDTSCPAEKSRRPPPHSYRGKKQRDGCGTTRHR